MHRLPLLTGPFLVVILGLAAATAAPPTRPEGILPQAERLRPALLKDLEELVNIDSGTGHKEGLTKVSGWMATRLSEQGAEVRTMPVETPPGVNLLATVKGTGKVSFLLLAHMDTVFAPGTAAKRPFRMDATKAYGPGVIDNKGGMLLGLYALKLLKQRGFTDFSRLTFLYNSDEEKGSFASRDLIREQARQHDFVLCLEPGKLPDAIVSWRKGIGYYKIEVKGKSAHAGADPERGRNAGLEMAHQVLQLSKLERPELLTSVNFTLFKSGDRPNVIPDQAFAQADVRVLYPDEYDRLERDFREVSKHRLIPDTEVKVIAERGRPPMPKSEKTEGIAQRLAQLYLLETGRTLTVVGSGGGTDANYAADAGATVIDGLGPVGDHLHADDEYLLLESLSPRLALLAATMMQLGR